MSDSKIKKLAILAVFFSIMAIGLSQSITSTTTGNNTTMDLKVNKSGDNMTGSLTFPSGCIKNCIVALDSTHLFSIGNTASNVYMNIGQDSTHNYELGWVYSSNPANAYANFVTYGYTNDFKIDSKNIKLQTVSLKPVTVGGSLVVNNLAGSGNAYVCVYANGTLYRNSTVCI